MLLTLTRHFMHKEKHSLSMCLGMGEGTANLHSGKSYHTSYYHDKEISGHLRQIILMYHLKKQNSKWLYHYYRNIFIAM